MTPMRGAARCSWSSLLRVKFFFARPSNALRLTRGGRSRYVESAHSTRGRRRVQPLLAGIWSHSTSKASELSPRLAKAEDDLRVRAKNLQYD